MIFEPVVTGPVAFEGSDHTAPRHPLALQSPIAVSGLLSPFVSRMRTLLPKSVP
ncbi:hypothetical protein [Streptomyces sp. P5_D11]